MRSNRPLSFKLQLLFNAVGAIFSLIMLIISFTREPFMNPYYSSANKYGADFYTDTARDLASLKYNTDQSAASSTFIAFVLCACFLVFFISRLFGTIRKRQEHEELLAALAAVANGNQQNGAPQYYNNYPNQQSTAYAAPQQNNGYPPNQGMY